ncbi:hypothetical protein AA0522_1892 [Gluconacetobacter liquefaciens NRIC 0522]|nr:hypothetical protein AA0522_1892 [Gluconacetobacter liquefaciens NRIC 0522]
MRVVMMNPDRKKKIVTPKPPGMSLDTPAWLNKTMMTEMALIPSSDGM